MEKRKLPLGIQTFRELREDGCCYVDKTAYALRMAQQGKHYFLSRPRRFGKSLFLDTLKELFEGLAAHDRWDWSVRHPVLRLSFGASDFSEAGSLHVNTMRQLHAIQRRTDAHSDSDTAPELFADLIESIHERTGQRVVVLVDEYDKPILDALGDRKTAEANRSYLHGLYSVVKDCDARIRFSFPTGVSKFSKVSLFSTLNNLTDLTLRCGYADLDSVFAPELARLDRERIREWYNDYRWRGDGAVYNPCDVLNLFATREFGNYWYGTGLPRFLAETVRRRGFATIALDGRQVSEDDLAIYDVDRLGDAALLFQTGFLTVAGEEEDWDGKRLYRLGYPNRSVRQSVNGLVLDAATGDSVERRGRGRRLREALAADDREGLRSVLGSLFASVPYELAHERSAGPVRGALRDGGVRLRLRRGTGRDAGGEHGRRPRGADGSHGRQGVPVRVQDGGRDGANRRGHAPAAAEGLRRQAPGGGSAAGRGGVQPPDAPSGGAGLRAGVRLGRRQTHGLIALREASSQDIGDKTA